MPTNLFHENINNDRNKKMPMKITRAPTLQSLSTEVQTLLQTSSLISSELTTLLRATQQILGAHNELKTRIKGVSEGLQDVIKVEEGVVSGDKDAFLGFETHDVVFGKTPPTTPPTLALSDSGQKIWRPKGREEDDKDGITKINLKRDRSSQQSSHSNSPSHQTSHINSSNVNANGYSKQPSPSIPGAYVFSEAASPVMAERDVLQPFNGLGRGGEDPIDINAVLAQLAVQEREDAEASKKKAEERANSKQSSKASSKRSTPAYRASPPRTTTETILGQQGQEQQQSNIWKPSSASPPNSTTVNGKIGDNNYAFFLNPDIEDIEYVDSPHASPATHTANVPAGSKSGYAYVNGHSNGPKPAAKTPPHVPSTDHLKNGRTNGAYSYAFTNGNTASTASTANNNSNGTAVRDYQATIRNNNNNGAPSRPSNPFAHSASTAHTNGNGVHIHAPAPAMPAGAARATKVPLRPTTPTVSRSTNGNGNGNGNGKGKGNGHTRSHTIQNQTNAELGSTIVRSASAMSNASASSTSVMSPPYAVFHPPPVRKSGSDSGSDSDSDLESQKFMEKLLERASDTEGIGGNKDKGKGKGKEKQKVVEEKQHGAPLPQVIEGDNNETRPRQTAESSTSKDTSSGSPAAGSSSKPNSKPPSIKSNTSPKTSGQALSDTATTPVATSPQENANKTGDNSQPDSTDAVNNPSETSAAPLAATPEITPMPVTSSRLHPSSSHSAVSTFSHDMLKSPQAGQRTPEPGETPRIANGNGNGNGGHSSSGSGSTTSLSLGAAGEAMQSMNINMGQTQNGTTAVKNGIQTIPPSAFGNVSATSSLKNPTTVVSSSTSRNSTVSMASFHPSSPSSSSTGGSGGSAPGSSNASPDSSPNVFPNGSIHSGGGGGSNSQAQVSSINVNGQAHSTRTSLNGARGYSHGSHGHNHGGHSSASSSVSTTSEMFARATITRQSHPTNISYSNGVSHGHNNVNGNGNRDTGGLFGQEGRSTSSYMPAPAGHPPGSTPPSSLTRHASLRRERERERERDREQRERESQRPIPSPVRASSARRSTVKMASVKTTGANPSANGNTGDMTIKVNNGDATTTEHVRTYARGHGHNRSMSDSSTISGVTPTQANFSSFHFNHFPGSSSSQSNNNMATISALPTFQPPATISMNPGKTSATTKLERWIPSLMTPEEREKKQEGATVTMNGVNGNSGGSGNGNSNGNSVASGGSGRETRRSVHGASPSSTTTSSSSSSSASISASAHQAQPSASTSNGNATNANSNPTATSNGVSKPTFEW